MSSRTATYGLGLAVGCTAGAAAVWLVATGGGRDRLRRMAGGTPTMPTHIELPDVYPEPEGVEVAEPVPAPV
jgi:hypothetical protein